MRSIPLASLALMLIVVPATPGWARDDPAASDLANMQGLWHALFLRQHDFANPALSYGMRVLVKGDTVTFSPTSTDRFTGTIKLDPSANPKRMDITVLDGPMKGKTVQNVYEFRKDVFQVKFCVASYDGDRGTRERPKQMRPGADDDFTTIEFLRAGDIHPEMLEKVRPGRNEPADVRAVFHAYARYLLAWNKDIPEISNSLLANPFVADDKVLRDAGAITAFQETHPGYFGGIDKFSPRILDFKTYAEAGEYLTPEMKARLDPVIQKDDYVFVVAQAIESDRTFRRLVIVGLRGKPGDAKILGVMKR